MFKSVWFGLILISSVFPGSAFGQNQPPVKELVQYVRDAAESLALPIHSELAGEDIAYVCAGIRTFYA